MRTRLILAALSVLLALGAPAHARGTLDSILPQIRAQHPGRLSDAEPYIGQDGIQHYRIKWMTPQGRILYFDADARTGRVRNTGDGGERWREGGGDWRRGRDENSSRGDSNRSHWNGGGDRGHWNGGGDRGGDWNGGGGDRHGGDGGWRGGHNGGDNGGHHHGG